MIRVSLLIHPPACTHIQTHMHKITLKLNQNDGNLHWLSDRSWSEASVACHHDLTAVKHATESSLSALWLDITELMTVFWFQVGRVSKYVKQ